MWTKTTRVWKGRNTTRSRQECDTRGQTEGIGKEEGIMGRRPRIRGTRHIYQLSVFREGLGERLFFSLFFFSTLKDTTHFTNMIPAIGNEQKHRVSRRDSLWSFKKKMRQNLNFCRSHSLFITFLSSPQVVKKTTQPGRLVSRQI